VKVTVERIVTGPLARQQTLAELERAVASAKTLDEVDRAVSAIPSLATYRGGSHVAVHPSWKGKFIDGSKRLAIVEEGT
jgi:hypothetical protein